MDIVEVGIDAGMMQRFPPTFEVLLGGTYESRIVASRLDINKAFVWPCAFGKGRF
jgi:hypothetical protein